MDTSINGVVVVVSYLVSEPRWYLVQCKPKEGFRAEEHLKNQSYNCFHPTVIMKRKIANTVRTTQVSMFPHYLFVYLNALDNWSAIRSTRGVSKIVQFNGLPASLDVQLIEELQRYCALQHNGMPEALYKVGDCLLVKDGCFKDIEGIVTAIDADKRVTLLFNLLNRPQQIKLSIHSVVCFA